MNPAPGIATAHPPSPRVRQAGAALGLVVRHEPDDPDATGAPVRRLRPLAEHLAREVRATRTGRVLHITGPSGAGKSTLLDELGAALRRRHIETGALGRDAPLDRPLVELIGGPVERALFWLSRVGLAEAALLARRPRELSDGQRWRLRLALALAGVRPGAWVLADEFGAVLDRPTALGVARSAAGAARATGRVLVAATAREDLGPALDADRTIALELQIGLGAAGTPAGAATR